MTTEIFLCAFQLFIIVKPCYFLVRGHICLNCQPWPVMWLKGKWAPPTLEFDEEGNAVALSHWTKHPGISNSFTLQTAQAGNMFAESPCCPSVSFHISNNARNRLYIIAGNVLEPFWLDLYSHSHSFHICCHPGSHLHFPQPALRLIVLIITHYLLCIHHAPLQPLC